MKEYTVQWLEHVPKKKKKKKKRTMQNFENKTSCTLGEERDKLKFQDIDGKLKI
jgi:hypothetical protein